MPIRPENVARYGPDWPALSWVIRWLRALGRCECRGECAGIPTWHGAAPRARCEALNGRPSIRTGATVVLTVAHLDHTPENMHPANLRAFCQACHLRYDREHHAETRRATRALARIAAGQLPLPYPEPGWLQDQVASSVASLDRLPANLRKSLGQPYWPPT